MSGGWLHWLDGGQRLPVIQVKPEAEPVIDWTVLATRLRANRTHTQKDGTETVIDGDYERQRLAAKIGVTVQSLEALWVGYGVEEGVTKYGKPFCHKFWSFPERNDKGGVTGIVRRIDKSGTGLPDEKFSMKGGRGGVYYEALWYTRKGPVFIPEGGSDTAALISMGLSAIGRPSCTGGVRYLKAMLAKYRKPVIVLAESDEQVSKRGKKEYCPTDCKGCLHCFPGMKGAKLVAKQLKDALDRKVDIVFPPDNAKDVRAWLNTHPGASAVDWIGAVDVKGKV